MAGKGAGARALKRALVFAAQAALTILVTVFVARRIGLEAGDFAELGPEWWSPRWMLLAISSVILLGANLFAGVIWGVMVRDMGASISPATAIRVFVVANFGRYVPGKLWQVAGLAVLAKREGVPAGVATGAAVLGHALSLGAATLVGGIAFTEITVGGGIEGWIVVAAVAALLGLLCTPPVLARLLPAWVRATGAEVAVDTIAWKHVARWILLLVAVWVIYGGAFALLAASFAVGGPPLAVGAAFVAAYVLGYIALFAPAGIGVREVALVALLGPVTGAAQAAGLAVAARLWATVVEVVTGVVFFSRGVRRPDPRGVTES